MGGGKIPPPVPFLCSLRSDERFRFSSRESHPCEDLSQPYPLRSTDGIRSYCGCTGVSLFLTERSSPQPRYQLRPERQPLSLPFFFLGASRVDPEAPFRQNVFIFLYSTVKVLLVFTDMISVRKGRGGICTRKASKTPLPKTQSPQFFI